jgi:NAD(P)-dependent dehydrogenase (short-subunit alcohol dehydrogenase family)
MNMDHKNKKQKRTTMSSPQRKILMSSNERVAVITGGEKGIGYNIAVQLGQSGLFQHICVTCREESQVESTVNSLKEKLSPDIKICCSPMELSDTRSHEDLGTTLKTLYGKIDVLVNNAGMAYDVDDSTPEEEQCSNTLNINFRGTCSLTEELLPLLRQGTDPRIINVVSEQGHLKQLSKERQKQFTADDLTMEELFDLMEEYENDVQEGNHLDKGWGKSFYGMADLALVAASQIWARNEPDITVDCCDPGYCKTDMTHHKGDRDPAEGAKCVVKPATMENPPTGAFYANNEIASW